MVIIYNNNLAQPVLFVNTFFKKFLKKSLQVGGVQYTHYNSCC